MGGVDRASFCRRLVGGGVEGGRVEEGGERVEGEREGRRQKSGGRKEGRKDEKGKVSSSSNETKVVEGRKEALSHLESSQRSESQCCSLRSAHT